MTGDADDDDVDVDVSRMITIIMAENIYQCEARLCQDKKVSSNRYYIESTHAEKLSFSRRDMAFIENKIFSISVFKGKIYYNTKTR